MSDLTAGERKQLKKEMNSEMKMLEDSHKQLTKADALRKKGDITESEFEAQKNKLLEDYEQRIAVVMEKASELFYFLRDSEPNKNPQHHCWGLRTCSH